MTYKNIIIWFVLFLCFQTEAQKQDSISKPSTLESIENYSKKNKFYQSIHKLIFKVKPKNQVSIREEEKIKPFDYAPFEGKVIRKINVQTMDPFGYSIQDSTKVPKKSLEKLGNRAHLKTKSFTVRNLLLFKKDQRLDSTKIKESERLLRSQRYIRRVQITPVLLANNPDSVDVNIKVLDSWSIFPTGSVSNSGGRIRLTTRNFAGLGHFFTAQYKTRFTDNKHAFQSQYQINNIARTFTNVGAYYNIDLDKNYQKSVYIDRPFYSPLAKNAGGINLSKYYYKDSIPTINNTNVKTNIKYNYYDIWYARAFRISKNENPEITNLITSARYNIINYKETPKPENDPVGLYSDQHLLLGSIGIASSQYKQTRFLFNYDIIEDINIGKNFSITGGLQWKNNKTRPYAGAKFSVGKLINENYLGLEFEWGTFFNGRDMEQSVIRIEALYFSKVYVYKNWRFRQFFNPEFVYGYHRLAYVKDRLNLNGKTNGIDGFYSYNLTGTKRVLISLQTQSYAPGSWLGFRFSPFLSGSIGWLGDENDKFLSNQMYSKIAIGILLNNDYLVFQNLQFSIALYPTIPGRGHNIIKTNNIRNDSFDLMRFNTGKPNTVSYQ